MAITITEINDYLVDLLTPESFKDIALNGIQVETGESIKRIAFAVDAASQTIQEAIKTGSQLLIVHHGFFWGHPLPITGVHRKRVGLMLKSNMGLIAYHLPLDAHKDFGNNSQILYKLGALPEHLAPFGDYKGNTIGWQVEFEPPISIESIFEKLKMNAEKKLAYLDFGNKDIRRIAVVSGGGASLFGEAIENLVDLYITGDAAHTLYHNAKENKINVLSAGHYFTETFGVKALQDELKKKFAIETVFLEIPTGL